MDTFVNLRFPTKSITFEITMLSGRISCYTRMNIQGVLSHIRFDDIWHGQRFRNEFNSHQVCTNVFFTAISFHWLTSYPYRICKIYQDKMINDKHPLYCIF